MSGSLFWMKSILAVIWGALCSVSMIRDHGNKAIVSFGELESLVEELEF